MKITLAIAAITLSSLIAYSQNPVPAMSATKIKDGGPATDALLNGPSSVKTDAAGNLYISDYDNNRVRKVDAKTGVITTIAGTGKHGFAGDGALATDAALKGPSDIAIDAKGNIYIADSYNNRIRKIDIATGNINTVVGTGRMGYTGDGGPALKATLNIPSSVAVDPAGNIYIADFGNNVIRKVDATSGNISTIAGDGKEGKKGDGGAATDAELDKPGGVAVTSSGDVYIADEVNCKIRKVDGSTGIITAVAGTGKEGKKGDNGPATSAQLSKPCSVALDAAGNIYIADEYNAEIRKVDASSGDITTIAGTGKEAVDAADGDATTTALDAPCGVAVDASGNVYLADHLTSLIRKIDSSGDMSTVAGKYVEPKKQ
jgi:sugar lactone lactonase YvrE